jgi:stringent starvation protein B
MSEFTSTKPYMIRAIHEWCVDNQLTPHLLVEVNSQTKVPMAYVKDGEIVLNLNYSATKDLQFTNEAVSFSARFSGVSNNLYVPIGAVKGIFARENGQGMFFDVQAEDESAVKQQKNKDITNKEKNISPEVKKNPLKLVK